MLHYWQGTNIPEALLINEHPETPEVHEQTIHSTAMCHGTLVEDG